MNVRSKREYVPIEPGGVDDPIGVRLLAELAAAPLRQRIVLPVYLLISAEVCFDGEQIEMAQAEWMPPPSN